MATATVSISATVTPAVTLSNPVSLDELQLLGSPTVSVGNTASVSGVLASSNGYYIYVEAGATGSTNGQALLNAYAAAEALVPTAASPATILLSPGQYDIENETWNFDTQHIRVVGLSHDPASTIIYGAGGTGTIVMSVANTGFANVTLDEITLTDSFSAAAGTCVFTNCVLVYAGDFPLSGGETYWMTFDNCFLKGVGKASSFAIIGGILHNCKVSGSNSLYLADGAVVRYSIVTPTLNAGSAINAKVYMCSLAAALGGNLTNDIGTPNNVVDSDVEL